MKIRKLQLEGYKVFDTLELDFTDLEGNTLDTVVLAGVNGSGKTSLLDLLEAIFSIYWNRDYDHRYYDYTRFKYRYQIGEELVKGCTTLEIFVEVPIQLFRNRIPLYYLEHLAFIDENNLPPNEIGMFLVKKDDYFGGHKLLYHLVTDTKFTYFYIKTNFLNNQIEQEVAKYLVDSLINGVVQKRELPAGLIIQEIIDRINNMFVGMDMKTKLVDITATEPIFESFNGKKISINQLSSGEKQLFYQAAYLQKLNLHNSIILIDEPETSLHPTWQRNILKLYQNIGENNQIIVATHSPHIIASVKPRSLFVLYPNSETGKIEPINMAKAHKHTKGVEPNRILQEVMGMDDLRDPETTAQIKEVAELLRLHPEQVELPENQAKIEKLREDLGKGDPFIMLLEYQLLLIKRRKLSQ